MIKNRRLFIFRIVLFAIVCINNFSSFLTNRFGMNIFIVLKLYRDCTDFSDAFLCRDIAIFSEDLIAPVHFFCFR